MFELLKSLARRAAGAYRRYLDSYPPLLDTKGLPPGSVISLERDCTVTYEQVRDYRIKTNGYRVWYP